jgi:DNA-binding transcriptional ArsR family regulator
MVNPSTIIANRQHSATDHAGRHAQLALIRDPRNWSPRHDCRPALRAAILARIHAPTLRAWSLWLTDRFTAGGELFGQADRAKLMRWSGISASTLSRYLRALQNAGLIEREQTARVVPATGLYAHAVVIRVAAEFRDVSTPDSSGPAKNAPEQRNGQRRPPHTPIGVFIPVDGSVVVRSSARNARAREAPHTSDEQWEPIAAADRAAAENWPRMARSRTDLPAFRPGYDDNITFDPDARRRLGIPEPAPVEDYDPATARKEPPF